MAKGKEVMVPMTDEQKAQLQQDYPQEAGMQRIMLPRFGLVSQDITEEVKDPKTKKKTINVISEAGSFFTEKQGEEEETIEVDGKEVKRKKWERTELGTEVEGTIIYQRKQLKYYDESTEEYTSSPIYDTDDEVIPLFLNKKEIARGTPAELKAKYPGTSKTSGKPISLLEDNRILYILIDGEIYQCNLRGSSMYSFFTYGRKTLVPSVLTKFASEAKEKGSINWNMMTFETIRELAKNEVDFVLGKVGEIKQGIGAEKAFYAQQAGTVQVEGETDEDFAKRKKALKDF